MTASRTTRTTRTALIVGAALVAAASFVTSASAHPVAPGSRIDARQARQDARIDRGIASGELTRHEARALQTQQARIAQAEAHARADGRLSAEERVRLDRMFDRASTDIYRQKHDRQDVDGRWAVWGYGRW